MDSDNPAPDSARAIGPCPDCDRDILVVAALLDAARVAGIGMTLTLGIRIVRAVEDAYKALPVEQRMEAMGMEQVHPSLVAANGRAVYAEVERD